MPISDATCITWGRGGTEALNFENCRNCPHACHTCIRSGHLEHQRLHMGCHMDHVGRSRHPQSFHMGCHMGQVGASGASKQTHGVSWVRWGILGLKASTWRVTWLRYGHPEPQSLHMGCHMGHVGASGGSPKASTFWRHSGRRVHSRMAPTLFSLATCTPPPHSYLSLIFSYSLFLLFPYFLVFSVLALMCGCGCLTGCECVCV